MYCRNCGKDNDDNAKFCTECGAPLAGMSGERMESGCTETQVQSGPAAGEKKKKGRKKFIVIGAIAAFFLICCAAGNSKTKICVTDTLTVTVSGPNGYGTATLENEDDWMYEALAVFKQKAGDYLEELEWIASVQADTVTFELSQTEGLSNGDVITVTATINEDDLEGLPIKLTSKKVKVEVSGLEDVQTADLFESIEVTYEGYAPYASVSVSGESSYTSVSYSIEGGDNLDIGDTFTITAQYDEDDLLAAGYVAESDTKTIAVTAADIESYVTEVSEITDEVLEEMKAQAEDTMAAYIADRSYDDITFGTPEYVGLYLLTIKEAFSDSLYDYWNAESGNKVWLIYKVSVSGSSSFTYYVGFRYTDLLIEADGSVSADLSTCTMTSNTFYKDSYLYSYKGYETYDEIYEAYVSGNAEEYDCESTIDE